MGILRGNHVILLINPNLPESPWGPSRMLPPLGLTYVAAALEKHGFEVKIFDNYLFKKPLNHIELLVKKLNPEIIGISCNSINYKDCVEIARAAKGAAPESKVVVGGPHPTCMPESVLDFEEVDFVVMGEGERAMVELAKHIIDGKNQCYGDVPGIAYKRNGKIVKNPPRFIENLDVIPTPARHLIPLSKYYRRIEFLDVEPVDIMNVIRGCPFHCKFCETRKIWGSNPRTFSPSRVVMEIEHLIANYGSRGIYFVADNFTINKKWTQKLCGLMMQHELDIEWVCDTRVDLVSRDLLRAMKKAGCKTIWFGVESGSPRILEKLGKGINLQQAVQAFRLCKEEGIKVACSFMLGIPGETIEDMKATLKIAMTLNPDWCRFNIFIACPGSNLYDEILEKKLYDRRDGFLLYVKTEDFNYESLLEIQKSFQKIFHRNPIRVVRKIIEHIKFLRIKDIL
ncbi:MAG: B12-binding domain-containing radical SAM protein [Candidatus Bathyarchaeota archaeon]|nr:B12-binding domain-containing radical SAM protein [Candidatus Bathyarchaeota archaeon]